MPTPHESVEAGVVSAEDCDAGGGAEPSVASATTGPPSGASSKRGPKQWSFCQWLGSWISARAQATSVTMAARIVFLLRFVLRTPSLRRRRRRDASFASDATSWCNGNTDATIICREAAARHLRTQAAGSLFWRLLSAFSLTAMATRSIKMARGHTRGGAFEPRSVRSTRLRMPGLRQGAARSYTGHRDSYNQHKLFFGRPSRSARR